MVYDDNVDCRALEVIGQDWSSEVVPLFLDWDVARVALICHLALDLLCQEMQEACQQSPLSHSTEASLSPWKGCDIMERSVVREFWAARSPLLSFFVGRCA